jgi:predicted acyltransferase
MRLYFYSNTLQSIAAGYLIASIAVLHFPLIAQIGLCAGLLVAYWLLLMFVPVPGHGAVLLQPDVNMAMWVDEIVLGPFRNMRPGYGYTWVLSSLGFGGTVLLGVFGGHVLRAKSLTPNKRILCIALLGVNCLLGGWLWSSYVPIIKHIWTSSMVLWAGGWSFLLLAFFYAVVDVIGWRKWAFPFVVIGMNSIVAYVGGEVLPFDDIAEWLMPAAVPHALAAIITSWFAFGVFWAILYAMYRKKIFVKV